MSVVVACNLSDGVVLGVDSAVTFGNPAGGVHKVYENADKLFQLGDKSVGIAAFGVSLLGSRSIGSYINEFEAEDPEHVVNRDAQVEDIVEQLRSFFIRKYRETVVPELESRFGKTFDDIPPNQRPVLGLAVGGFSAGAHLSQVWEVVVPLHEKTGSARRWRREGNFGGTWFALNDPIIRYFKGFDRSLLAELKEYFVGQRGTNLTDDENREIERIVQKYEYQVPFAAMPIKEGIAHVKFLVEMVVNHHRFALGAPIVGGKARIGLVTYKGEKFRILEGV